MKILRTLIWFFAVVLVIVLVGAAFFPAKQSFTETILINAPAEKIYKQVNCFKNWKTWSPWEEGIKKQKYGDTLCGKGASRTWMSEEDGKGKQVILLSESNTHIKTKLDFEQGSKAVSEWHFEKADSSDATKVSWSFETQAGYPLGRWISKLVIIPLVQKSYAKGLEALKLHVENMPEDSLPENSADFVIETFDEQWLVSARGGTEAENIPARMKEAFDAVIRKMSKEKLKASGAPFVIWHSKKGEIYDMECGIPYGGKEFKPSKKTERSKLPGGTVLTFMHKGSYDGLQQSWLKLRTYAKKSGYELNGAPFEEYLTDPKTEKDSSKWLTKLYQPILGDEVSK